MLSPPGTAQTAGENGGGGHGAGEARKVGGGETDIYMYEGSAQRGGDYKRKLGDYSVPEVTLKNRRGEEVRLDELLARDAPVALQFIFTSCATICPVLSAGMAQAREGMRDIDPDTRLVSISIDPDYDTPPRLRDYAARFDAGEKWSFLTGDFADIRKVLLAFDALYEAGNKMYHRPYTYLRPAPGAPWLRLKGLLSAEDLTGEYAAVMKAGSATASSAGGR